MHPPAASGVNVVGSGTGTSATASVEPTERVLPESPAPAPIAEFGVFTWAPPDRLSDAPLPYT
jgi:hypothetical protein